LLLAALGLALGRASWRTQLWSFIALSGTVAVLLQIKFAYSWIEIAFLGCWASTAATAASVYLPRSPGMLACVVLSLNAGLWVSAVVALAAAPSDLIAAFPAVLLAIPAAWLTRRRASIAVKVASSWLIAIAMLVAALPFLSTTPGYLPDHLE
jgi:hypothetical protein